MPGTRNAILGLLDSVIGANWAASGAARDQAPAAEVDQPLDDVVGVAVALGDAVHS